MGLRLFFLPNFPAATFIQGATFIPDSRVPTSSRPRSYWMTLNRENPKVWAKVFFFDALWRSYFMKFMFVLLLVLKIAISTTIYAGKYYI